MAKQDRKDIHSHSNVLKIYSCFLYALSITDYDLDFSECVVQKEMCLLCNLKKA